MPKINSNGVDVVKEVYSCINQNDFTKLLEIFAPNIERVEPEGFPESGTYHGHDKVLAHFTKARATWAEGECKPEEFFVSEDKVVVLVHVHVRLKDKTEWLDGHVADGFVVRNGQIFQMLSFLDKKKAFAWAGINS